MVAKHHSKANHLSLTDYDSSHSCRFLMFLDANNLYGKAMMDFLPVGGFRWMSREELMVEFICGLPDEGEFGCFVDCMLVYPLALHDVHDDYPLAPVKRKVSYEDLSPHAKKMCDRHRLKHTLNKEKLLTTFETRRHYVLHYRSLKLYSSLGLIVSEVHGVWCLDRHWSLETMFSSIHYIVHRLGMILTSISTSFCPIACLIKRLRIQRRGLKLSCVG